MPRQDALALQLADQIPSLLAELAEEQARRREGQLLALARAGGPSSITMPSAMTSLKRMMSVAAIVMARMPSDLL